jgi:hypothetical protein
MSFGIANPVQTQNSSSFLKELRHEWIALDHFGEWFQNDDPAWSSSP